MLKDFANSFSGFGRAFNVTSGSNALANVLALFRRDWLLASLVQLLNGFGIEAKIFLASDKDDWKARTEVKDFRNPLLLNVVERIWGIDSETDEDDMGIGVGERTKTVVILLTSRIP